MPGATRTSRQSARVKCHTRQSRLAGYFLPRVQAHVRAHHCCFPAPWQRQPSAETAANAPRLTTPAARTENPPAHPSRGRPQPPADSLRATPRASTRLPGGERAASVWPQSRLPPRPTNWPRQNPLRYRHIPKDRFARRHSLVPPALAIATPPCAAKNSFLRQTGECTQWRHATPCPPAPAGDKGKSANDR